MAGNPNPVVSTVLLELILRELQVLLYRRTISLGIRAFFSTCYNRRLCPKTNKKKKKRTRETMQRKKEGEAR